MDWTSLLDALAAEPRENGSPALRETAAFLASALRDLGVDVEIFAFTAHPQRVRIAGVVVLAGTALYALLLLARRPRLALATAIIVPAAFLLEMEAYVPVFGWPGAVPQHHVIGHFPAHQPEQQLLFTCHYDTKTDVLDHVERAPISFLGLPVAAFMILAAALACRRRPPERLSRTSRAAAVTAVLYGVGMFVSTTAGAFLARRSPGALDNGAACATLLRLAESLATSPPAARTDVDLIFLSAEENGVEGSWELAEARFPTPPEMPTAVVNLEGVGAASDLAVFGGEAFVTHAYEPDAALLELLDTVHRQVRKKPIHVTWYPAATDARSFLAHGIPAATLTSDLPGHAPPRHLHSAADDRTRIDPVALDSTRDYLLRVVRAIDERALSGS